jgi:hypothetical protein
MHNAGNQPNAAAEQKPATITATYLTTLNLNPEP